MITCCLTLALAAVCSKVTLAVDTYNAVVVEYQPPSNPSLDADTNMLNNAKNYINIINLASKTYLADIIVFPECGLVGSNNQDKYLEVPDPINKVILCAKKTEYETPLVQLSCAARSTGTYVVVNVPEKYYSYEEKRELRFNTNVVFDCYGAIIARYRKIHLFGEGLTPSVDKALVYFDTEFGVRFGIFTCFDIIFKDPGVLLAENYNISHFIFPTEWFSESPFLTAIQEQWYWSYTLNAVLLASGYNQPEVGSSGTGIYLGRKGPAIYSMPEETGTFMLFAKIPKIVPKDYSLAGDATVSFVKLPDIRNNYVEKEQLHSSSPSKLTLKRDFLEVYSTQLITVPKDAQVHFNGSDVVTPFDLETRLCNNSFCCEFSLKITVGFNQNRANISRGDDYSQLYYRLAAFDGVRTYDHVTTGGLQTCAIIPCVTEDLSSCGLRSDDPSAQPNMMLKYYQKYFIFESIKITATFSNNNSFVGPNVLLKGEDSNYGSLLESEAFDFIANNVTDYTAVKTLQTDKPINNLVTASLYGRIFARDGQAYTGSQEENSSAFDLCINILLLISTFVMIKYST